MKKVILVMLVILMNVCLTSCETDDMFYEEINQIEFSVDDGEDEILPPPKS